jgi:hypothetical protein
MNAKASFTTASVLSLLFAGAAFCQAPPAPAGTTAPPTRTMSPDPEGYSYPAPTVGTVPTPPPPSAAEAPTPIPDHWITYPQPYCCGPVGGNGPIMSEVYVRVGPTFPFSSHALSKALGTGWEIQVGGRSLFFNVPRDRAFTVDLSIANAYNHADDGSIVFNVLGKPATARSVNRTFGTIGLGQERWLLGSANTCCSDGWNWRWGYDGGFRYGTVRLDMNVPVSPPDFPSGFARLNSRSYGTYLAIHSDVEKPCGCCTFIFGGRLEWQYDWIGALGSRSDIQGLNLLFNIGTRF